MNASGLGRAIEDLEKRVNQLEQKLSLHLVLIDAAATGLTLVANHLERIEADVKILKEGVP